ncbi:MAG: dihydroorotase [Nitrospirota bacterium]|jgi:dihydroorotase
MYDLVIENGHLIDPAHGIDRPCDLGIQDGRVAQVGGDMEGRDIIDAAGLIVCPGLIDLHVHLREPGQEWKEDILSGSRAAAAGGITTICPMPNTAPTNDSASVTRLMLKRAELAPVKVKPIGALTHGLQGEALADLGELFETGCVAFSDDGRGVQDGLVMRHAMEYLRPFGVPVIIHAQDDCLFDHGVMNEGWRATELGLRGICNAAEDVHIDRDIRLCELTGTPLHVAHISTRGGVDLVRRAQARGLAVSAEAAPHHLLLTDEEMPPFDTHWKMSPPLRSPADRDAVRDAVIDGTIAAIATDHAPHAPEEKERPFDEAPFGIIGLETCLPLSLSLVRDHGMTMSDLIARLTSGPAAILGIDTGHVGPGAVADVTIFDPHTTWTYDSDRHFSKSRNTPWEGRPMVGRAVYTLVDGRVVYRHGELVTA